MYVEDLDCFYKVWKSGYKLYYMPTSKVWYKVGASHGEDEVSEFSAYWIMRNRVKFIKKSPILKKVTSLMFLILSRMIRYPLWLPRKKQIILAQIKGIYRGLIK
jgi:GT2 family glycosyltransferase